ncbi:glycine-rich cell wall structural protein 1-like [Durio zibethinus]|uniref:Glycine-rich cell wall structural protein 1-like n=1 Tax=Durio zibethinus TaxID=66656 RepID=A0A6P6A7X9_DURZI|nr:glycine-rich cell wall structural protein 1-like [Durio zibethinus]
MRSLTTRSRLLAMDALYHGASIATVLGTLDATVGLHCLNASHDLDGLYVGGRQGGLGSGEGLTSGVQMGGQLGGSASNGITSGASVGGDKEIVRGLSRGGVGSAATSANDGGGNIGATSEGSVRASFGVEVPEG